MDSNSTFFDKTLEFRRSVRVFTPEKTLQPDTIKKNVQRATLAPNSSNMQLWEFIRVHSITTKAKLAEYCFNQSAAKTAEELLIIVTRRDNWKKRAQQNVHFLEQSFKDKGITELSKRELRGLNYYKKIMPFLYMRAGGLIGFIRKIIVTITGLFKVSYRNVSENDMRVVAHKSVALAAQTFMLGMAADGYDTCPMEGFDEKRVKQLLDLPASAEINMIIACGTRADNGIWNDRFRVDIEEVYQEIL